MKKLILSAVLLLGVANLNVKANQSNAFFEHEGAGSHGFTSSRNGGEGTRPVISDGTRGGFEGGGHTELY